MIKSKDDLIHYLEMDKIALRYDTQSKPSFMKDEIWKFEILLRKNEYLTNCKTSVLYH